MTEQREWIAYTVTPTLAGGNPYGVISGLQKVYTDKSWAFRPADVNLLAAAPELGDACEEFERYFDTDQPTTDAMLAAWERLRGKVATALAKLRGTADPNLTPNQKGPPQ